MTSSFHNSIPGKAEWDGFVSNRARESSGQCLNCCFRVMKRTETFLLLFVQNAHFNCCIVVHLQYPAQYSGDVGIDLKEPDI